MRVSDRRALDEPVPKNRDGPPLSPSVTTLVGASASGQELTHDHLDVEDWWCGRWRPQTGDGQNTARPIDDLHTGDTNAVGPTLGPLSEYPHLRPRSGAARLTRGPARLFPRGCGRSGNHLRVGE